MLGQLDTREQFAAIVAVVRASKNANPGKKALQKLIYLLEKEIGLDLGYSFKFYTHGVFSRDLAGDLDIMKSMKLLNIDYEESSETYRISIGPEADKFLSRVYDTGKLDFEKINRLAERYSAFPAWKLEIISTAQYIEDEEAPSPGDIVDRVLELKPKFSRFEVDATLREAGRSVQ